MIKTFENCSPEYQITIVWFFIFLTLLLYDSGYL